ncbi:MAG: type VII secretion protein EccC, partial [Mycobacterium sp.]|nr:type VII secretion protein EccC [Mycobacterium sp.]
DEVNVAAPPPLPQARGGLLTALPMLAVVVMLGVGALAWSSGSVSHAPTALMFPAMMLVSALGMLAQSAVRRGAAELDDHRRRYLDHLGALADQLTDAAVRQHDSLVWVHPEPAALWTVADGPRVFERAPDDSDFGHVRVGVGAQ